MHCIWPGKHLVFSSVPGIYQVFCDSNSSSRNDGECLPYTWCFAARVFRYDKYLCFTRFLADWYSGRKTPGFHQDKGRKVYRGGKFAISQKRLESKGRGLKIRRFCDILPKMLVFSRFPGFYLVKAR